MIRTASWPIMAGACFVLGTVLAATAVAAVVTPNYAGAAVFAPLAVMLLMTGVLFLSGARRPPVVTVTRDGLVFDVPGVLREPVSVPRAQVRTVYLRDAIDVRSEGRDRVWASTTTVPSLTFGEIASPQEWKLLFVFAAPLDLRPLVRRTTVFRTVALFFAKFYGNELPGLRTVARGIACEPKRLQEAVNALWAAGYPVTRPPYAPADRASLGA